MVLFVERLKLKTASEYTYLSQSDCLTINGVDDAQKFHKLLVFKKNLFPVLVVPHCQIFVISVFLTTIFVFLQEAFDIVQIPKEQQERAFALLAAVLWLGNVSFRVTDNENHVEVVADEGRIYCLKSSKLLTW